MPLVPTISVFMSSLYIDNSSSTLMALDMLICLREFCQGKMMDRDQVSGRRTLVEERSQNLNFAHARDISNNILGKMGVTDIYGRADAF
jgi:hypothetical protein